jgi:CTP synthase (UTP-ammonia lyase)
MELRIGIVGDFNFSFQSHHATGDCIGHAAAHLGVVADVRWIPTPLFAEGDPDGLLRDVDALWASPGSPYASFDGMLRAIRVARERNWPFLGT